MRSSAKFATVLFGLVLAAGASASQAPPAPDTERYLGELRHERQESWLGRELRELRLFPHLDRAYRLMEAGQAGEARREFERYLELDPDDLEVRFEYVLLLYREQDWTRAVAEAGLILARRPRFVPGLLYRGMALQALGELEAAALDFEAVAAMTDADLDSRRFALGSAADVALLGERYDEASRALDRLRELGEDDFSLHYRRGVAFQARGVFADARRAFERAIGVAADERERLEASLGVGESALRLSDLEAAERSFAAALAIEFRPALARRLAEIAHERRDDPAAESWMRRALAADDRPADREFLAHLLDLGGDPAAAAREFAAAAEALQDPDDRCRVLVALGHARAKSGDTRGAADAFRRAADLREDPAALEGLAEAEARRGRWDAAAAAYERLLVRRPSASVHYRLALVQLRAGRDGDAERQLSAAVTGGLSRESRSRALEQLGDLHQRAGRFAEARTAFEAALADRPGDARLLAALGRACLAAGDAGAAAEYLERSVEIRGDGETLRALALARREQGDTERAIETYRRVLEASPLGSPDLDALTGLAHLEAEAGRYREASELFLEALDSGAGPAPELLENAAESLAKAGEWEEALALTRRLEGLDGRSADERARTQERLGFLLARLGRYDESAAAFREALGLGLGEAGVHRNLAFILFKAGRWTEALDGFQAALAAEPSARAHLYVGRCYTELGKPGLAIYHLEQAAAGLGELEAEDREAVLDELGYLYFDESEFAKAADVWSRSLRGDDDPVKSLHVGMAYRQASQPELARQVLDGISPAALEEDLRAKRLDELAEIERAAGHSEAATELLIEASRIADDTERLYRLGLAYRDLERWDDARSCFEAAARREPRETRYAEALGYALAREKNYDGAIVQLEKVVAADSDYLALYEDLGYLHMRAKNNRRAAGWFKQAIDNRLIYPAFTRAERSDLDGDLYPLRKEVTKLTNRFDVNLHFALRSDDFPESVAGGGFAGGVLPSQAGAEIAFEPPEIGFRDERVFQAFVRLLANLEPNGVAPLEESYQGGLGVRYKPLRQQVLFLSVERLFRIGESSVDDWLLRGQYVFARGDGFRPRRSAWSSTHLYLDAGYFVDDPGTWAYYAELRQGVTFRLGPGLLLTPHFVADGRYETPGGSRSSYVETGGGLSLKLFQRGRYQVETSAFEILLQYRAGEFLDRDARFTGETFDGIVTTAVVHF